MGFKIGLALGGGGAKGLAHLGVIKQLEHCGIPIDIITGTSIGAIIGALYASKPDSNYTINHVISYLNSKDFDKTRLEFLKKGQNEERGLVSQLKTILRTGLFLTVYLNQQSFISKETLQQNLEKLLPNSHLEDSQIPLGLVALSLEDNQPAEIKFGNLIDSVMASCAIPGIFPPIYLDKKMMVDGGWVDPVPVSLAKKMGADFVIAIDVAPESDFTSIANNALEISQKASEATRMYLKSRLLKQANHTIQVDTSDIHWADFLKYEQCIASGVSAVDQNIEVLRKKIFRKKICSFFTRMISFSKYGH
jgi:NTE family protein